MRLVNTRRIALCIVASLAAGASISAQTVIIYFDDSAREIRQRQLRPPPPPPSMPGLDAQQVWKNTAGNTDFNAGTSWVSGIAPGAGDVAAFTAARVAQPNVSASLSISGLYFAGTATNNYTLSASASQALTLTGFAASIGAETGDSNAVAIGAENTSGTNVISAPIILAPASGSTSTIFQEAGGILQINGAISGSGITLVKTGAGTLVMNTTASTFSGGLTLNAGNLNLNVSSNVFTAGVLTSGALGTGTLTLAGGTIQSNSSSARTISNKVTILGDIVFGSTTTFTGTLDFNTISNYTTPPTNPFTLGGPGSSQRTLTINVATSFKGAIVETNAGTGIIKLGAATLTFGNGTAAEGANTYTGLTDIQAGELDLNKSASKDALAGDVQVGGTGTVLKLLNSEQIKDTASVTVNAGGTFNLNAQNETIAALNGNGGTVTSTGTPTFTVGSNNATGSYAGTIAGTLKLTKIGAGVQTLTGANTYTGATTISNGTLQLGNGGTTGTLSPSSAISIASGAVLRFNRTSGSNFVQGTDFSSAAITGAGGIIKDGTDSLTFNVANTFSGGLTINSGTVIASADGALGAGNVSLTAGSVTLTLQNGVTQNYINDAKTLSYVNTDVINLNYVGTDVVAGLMVDGVAQAAGVYGALGLNPDGVFAGTGTITVVPEPTTVGMMVLGASLLIGLQRFRRKLR